MRAKTKRVLSIGVLIGTALTTLVACAPSEQPTSDTDAITNRPQRYDRFIAIARLSEPPLLVSGTGQGADLRIDPAAANRLEEEQQSFLERLSADFDDVQVLHRYKYTLNGVVIAAPIRFKGDFTGLAEVSFVESSGAFAAVPATETVVLDATTNDMENENPAVFIGARRMAQLSVRDDQGREVPITGRGLRVGVIDTGIDYTHSALGGSGNAEQHASNDPDQLEDSTFPNDKVVGGIDLVGASYNPMSPDFTDHIPVPDSDPLDIQGHGTHVAATIAGRGDNENTYDGVAPEASLFAIKVFSDGGYGSTSDHIVIAALEYAMDPDQNGDLADRLDVINLSLGSNFGTEHILYEEALANLVERGGVVASCSAGNSGDQAFIVGAPSTVPAAISVAASVDDSVEDGELTDTLASFSSRGPRSLDGAFKPEIAAPGYQILSASAGTGSEGVRLNGTSMAAPHITGVAALLRQAHADWSPSQIKDAMLSTAQPMADANDRGYPLALQGAGRVDVYRAATTSLVASPATLSLGVLDLESTATYQRSVTLSNLSDEPVSLTLTTTSSPGLTLTVPASIEIPANEQVDVSLAFAINPERIHDLTTLDARLTATAANGAVVRVHAIATVRAGSDVALTGAEVDGESMALTFAASKSGAVQVFQMIAADDDEQQVTSNPFRDDGCDLKQVGYRVVEKEIEGESTQVAQIAVVLAEPVTSWHVCEISVLLDHDGNRKPEQEVVGTYLSMLSDRYENGESRFYSFLMDAGRMTSERRAIEDRYSLFSRPSEDYVGAAMVSYRPFTTTSASRVSILEVVLSEIDTETPEDLRIKVGSLTGSGSPGADDFLENGEQQWFAIDVSTPSQLGPESLTVAGGTSETLEVQTNGPLLIVAPGNREQGAVSQVLQQ